MRKIHHFFRPIYVPVATLLSRYFRAPRRYRHLFDEIRRVRAVRILEVGTWNGNRAIEMIEAARRATPGTPVAYFGFDLFEQLTDELFEHELSKKPPSKLEVEAKLKATGAAITLVQGNTRETLPEFARTAEPMDLIFIDGGHHVNTVRSDWEAVRSLMHERTVVLFDDYWRNRGDESAKPVVDAIDRSLYDVEVLPEKDVFENAHHGYLEISFAKVTKKP